MIMSRTPIGMGSVPKMMYLIYKAEHNGNNWIYLIGCFSVLPCELKDMSIQTMFAKCGLYYDKAVEDMEDGCKYISGFDMGNVEVVDYDTLSDLCDGSEKMIKLEF